MPSPRTSRPCPSNLYTILPRSCCRLAPPPRPPNPCAPPARISVHSPFPLLQRRALPPRISNLVFSNFISNFLRGVPMRQSSSSSWPKSDQSSECVFPLNFYFERRMCYFVMSIKYLCLLLKGMMKNPLIYLIRQILSCGCPIVT